MMHGFPQDGGQAPISLTPAERAQVAARSRREVGIVILSQTLAGALVSLIMWLAGSKALGLSALCGCLTYLIPNAVFGARLALATYRTRGASPVVFFVGQAVKVAVAVGLLWGLSRLDSDWLSWPAVVTGLIVTLKGYWLMVILTGGRIAKYM